MFSVEIFCNYISRCSKSEVSFVNEMSLIKKGSFESRIFDSSICIRLALIFFNKTRKSCVTDRNFQTSNFLTS